MGSPVHFPVNADRAPDRFLVLLKTTTKEKVIQYQTVARLLGLPIQFRALNELVDGFPSALEDTGNRVGNANQKFEKADKKTRPLYDETSPLYKPYEKLLREKCAEWGVIFDRDTIFLAADDSTFEVVRKVWDVLYDRLTPYVPNALLRSAGRKGEKAGPGAETGPIAAAVGTSRLLNLMHMAMHETCSHDKKTGKPKAELTECMSLTDTRSLVLRSLREAAAGMEPYELSSYAQHQIFAPDGRGKPLPEPGTPFVQTGRFFKVHRNADRPITDDWLGYLKNFGNHQEIVRKLYARVQHVKPLPPSKENAAVTKRKMAAKDDFKVIHVGCSTRHDRKYNSFHDALSLEYLYKGTDAAKFVPFKAADDSVRRHNYYKLVSWLVAKQLDHRFMNCPGVMHDDGSWTPMVNLMFELANKGMNKDFLLSSYEGGPLIDGMDIEHFATAYLDVLRGDDKRTTNRVGNRVMDIRKEGYSRYRYPDGHEPKSDADKPDAKRRHKPKGMFTVGVFTSASSDNRKLINTLEKYGRHVAKRNAGLVWGGGDRHAMGAVLEGYLDGAGKAGKPSDQWIAGFTTRLIAETETLDGQYPEACDFPRAYSPDIYQRIADMVDHSDMIVVGPGGLGTVQEFLALLVLRDRMPEKMADKKIVIYSPDIHESNGNMKDLFWANAVKAFLGEEYWENLQKRPIAGSDNVYLATNLGDLRYVHNMLQAEFEAKNKLPEPKAASARRAAAARGLAA